MKQHLDALLTQIASFLPSLLYALVILIVGLIITKIVMSFLTRALRASKLDVSLHAFFRSIVKVVLIAVVLLTCAGALGINTGSFLAILGAVGLAASLAVKDSLANLASGLMILITHPFRVGDYIETDGAAGTVNEIGLIYTRLNTPDNKRIFLPNSTVTTAKITNFSAEDIRRLDLVFSIGYSDDFERAKELIANVIIASPLALCDPTPIVRAASHTASSVDIATRIWVKTDNYYDLDFDMHEKVKVAFDSNGITAAIPKLDVNICE
ncbi:MAG: mechanosensitive ion channel [Clostridia bacterium]